ncbi:MAG: hypothetical protein WC101_02195 [Candidatus Gracilibacteria bacterium]
MKKRLLVLIAAVLLTGCKSTQTLAEKESRCIAYKDTVKSQIEYENSIAENPSPSHSWTFELEEIFFSNKLNTCVYVEGKGLYDGPTNVATGYVIKDFYNNRELQSFTVKTDREFTGKLNEFEKYIEEIKT